MKLLLDENLSRRILPLLEASYPGSSHVSLLGLERADDKSIWLFAQQGDYIIVTKDDDFQALLNTLGHPPKLVRLRMGNCSNEAVVAALNAHAAAIRTSLADPELGLVELYGQEQSSSS